MIREVPFLFHSIMPLDRGSFLFNGEHCVGFFEEVCCFGVFGGSGSVFNNFLHGG